MQNPILIMGAMNIETENLLEKMQEYKKINIANYEFYEDEINAYPVVIAKTKVGTIHSAVVTSLAIQKYQPICIISQGTAGGIGNNIRTKDIVIGEEVLHTMSAKTPVRKKGEGSNSTKWDYITFIADGEDKKITQKANRELVEFFSKLDYKEGNIHKGIIGSGDVWNREEDRMIYLSNVHKVSCEDMESISIYTIANQYNIPVVGIRIISDNELLQEEYDRNVGKICQCFIHDAVQKLIEKIKGKK